jgi:DNA-binding NarL/FixJ family response regulator
MAQHFDVEYFLFAGMTLELKILLADDHQILRSGLRALLESQPGFEVVGEAQDGRTAVRLVSELSPDVVIMDLRMPDLNGVETTRLAVAAKPDVRIIVLSAHFDHRMVGEAIKAGAAGYVAKESAFEELARAIRTVMSGKRFLSPRVTAGVIDEYLQSGTTDDGVCSPLSAREREVLQLMADGKSTKEIAMHLQLSIKTIETHRLRIMQKVNLHSVAELTKYALREGITSLDNK